MTAVFMPTAQPPLQPGMLPSAQQLTTIGARKKTANREGCRSNNPLGRAAG
jgi:hypothetical protein